MARTHEFYRLERQTFRSAKTDIDITKSSLQRKVLSLEAKIEEQPATLSYRIISQHICRCELRAQGSHLKLLLDALKHAHNELPIR